MHIVIAYDSVFGNTAKVAEAMEQELAPLHAVRMVFLPQSNEVDFSATELLIVGSPTRGFRPTPATVEFLESLPASAGIKAAAFDTRMSLDDIHPAPLRWVVEAGGYAAERIATHLESRGFASAGHPAGFFVEGTEGPLKPGEIERARHWAKSLVG